MPMGISRCGFFVSCAAVETASNPMYAKKITPAPRATPDHPYSPKFPVLGGMNGCQFLEAISGWCRTKYPATPMKTRTMETFSITIALFRLADSLMPTTRTVVTKQIAMNATRLKAPVACGSVDGSMLAVFIVSVRLLSNCQWSLYRTRSAPGVAIKEGGR